MRFPQHRETLLLSTGAYILLLLLIYGIGCGGGNETSSPSIVRPTATPTPSSTPSPTPQPTPSWFLPGVTGTRGDLPVFWETSAGIGTYILIPPDSGLPTNLPVARRITAPQTYGDRAFVKWESDGSEFSNSPSVDPTQISHGSVTLRAVYQPRSKGADGFQPGYLRPTFHHWNHFPLNVHFDRHTLSDADMILIRNGLDQWMRASGGAIRYNVTENADTADIEINTGEMELNRLGYTQVWWGSDGVISRAVITLATFTLSTDQRHLLTATCTHEFGHALGMIGQSDAGHSDNENDLMYSTITSPQRIITERDMNTLTGLYPGLLSSEGKARRTLAPEGAGTAVSY